MKLVGATITAMLLLLAACGGSDGSPIQEGATAIGRESSPPAQATATATPAPTPTPEKPAPALEVVFLNVDPSERLLRFVALVHNPSAKSIEGLTIRWDASDASGALVGSHSTKLPPIAGGTTFSYVGGAGSLLLSGVPETVKLTVEDAGRLTDNPSSLFAVEAVTMVPEPAALGGQATYKVSATVTTGLAEVSGSALLVDTILRDASGAIVGADFDRPSNLPERIPPGTKVKVEIRFVRAKSEPTSAEVVAFAE